jgi:hypothetical protein
MPRVHEPARTERLHPIFLGVCFASVWSGAAPVEALSMNIPLIRSMAPLRQNYQTRTLTLALSPFRLPSSPSCNSEWLLIVSLGGGDLDKQGRRGDAPSRRPARREASALGGRAALGSTLCIGRLTPSLPLGKLLVVRS